MTIRTRLALLFGLIASTLLVFFCLAIYFFAEKHRQNEFRERLRAEAVTSVELLFGKETISPELFKLLDRNQITVLTQEEIIVYDYLNKIIYESGTDYLDVPRQVLDQVRLEKEVHWREGGREVVGVHYTDRFNRFVVFASAIDKYGFSKARNLAFLLTAGGLLMSALVFAAGWVYAGRSLRPLKKIISQMDSTTAAQLSQRLPEGEQKDELAQLAQRFNRMLDRLEDAFQMQRAFVSNASHELRTPLTAITGQIQVALLAKDDPQQLHAMLESVLDDVRELNRLTNGLLTLASLSVDELSVGFTPVSLDELLWQTRVELLKLQPGCTVRTRLENQPETAAGWLVQANETLLRNALLNLMENGCKFSPDRTVSVTLAATPDAFRISFHNAGAAIPAGELPEIFKPFRRGSNARHLAGHGIGLSLTQRIVQLHRGRLTVESNPQTGSTFTVALPFH